MYAAQRGNVIMLCSILIEQGADVNAKDNNGTTPLIYAAQSGQTELCSILIEQGANVNAKDCFDRTPLSYAYHSNLTEVFNLLMQHTKK